MDGFDLRVILLTSDFAPVQGGIGNYATEIAKRVSDDVELHVVAPNPKVSNDAAPANEETEHFPDHVTIHRLGSGKGGFLSDLDFQIKCRSFVKSIARKEKIDLIHSQSTMPDLFIRGDAISIPIVTTIHTTVTGHVAALRESGIPFNQMSRSEKSTLMISPFFRALERRYYSGSRRYITVSEWGKKTVSKEKKIDQAKIEVIYIGVDPERYSPSNRVDAVKHFGSIPETSAPKVLYFSRFATRKGVHLLADAIPRILEKVDAHFIFAGSGQMPKINTPKENVTILGYVPSELTHKLYAMSDIFILPSLYENFPSCILEAMASECAPIATDIAGIPEMIRHGENGILIKPHDVDAIVQSVIDLASDDSLRLKMAKEGRKSAIERFSWNDSISKMESHYGDVINSYKRKTR